jgi:hypothetical protein
MDLVLKNLVGDESYVFIDYDIVFSRTTEEHASRMQCVLERLDNVNLQLHPEKCSIANRRSII